MPGSQRFGLAIHLLVLATLAREWPPDRDPPGGADGPTSGKPFSGDVMTSEWLAGRMNIHPVVVRRLVSHLKEAELMAARPGPGGGVRLAVEPETVTLRDIYRAVERDSRFSLPLRPARADCLVGKTLPPILTECFQAAEQAMEERLAEVTLAEVADAIREQCRSAAGRIDHSLMEATS